MGTARDLVVARLKPEEGYEQFPYDDATGKRVRAPVGNITWLYGCNLETSGSPELATLVLGWQVDQVEKQLLPLAWYSALDDVRKSVCLDIAFNGGVAGLLHYPHMIAALSRQDWPTASQECAVADPKLDASRYAPLRQLLLVGGMT